MHEIDNSFLLVEYLIEIKTKNNTKYLTIIKHLIIVRLIIFLDLAFLLRWHVIIKYFLKI